MMKLWQSKSWVENPYSQLLSVLLLLIIASPFLLNNRGRIIVSVIYVISILVVINRFHFRNRVDKFGYLALAMVSLIVQIFDYSFSQLSYSLAFNCISAAIYITFLSIALYFMTKLIFKARRVTNDIIKGSICIYLLIGLWFSILYELIEHIDSRAFLIASPPGYQNQFNPLYFSFITLTTTGYGDVIPFHPLAKMLSMLEGIIGVLYPAVVIARLVSLYIAEEEK